MTDKKKHRINTLARKLGVSVQTIKNYEDQGILPTPTRDSNGWRYYTDEDVLKIKALYHGELVREHR